QQRHGEGDPQPTGIRPIPVDDHSVRDGVGQRALLAVERRWGLTETIRYYRSVTQSFTYMWRATRVAPGFILPGRPFRLHPGRHRSANGLEKSHGEKARGLANPVRRRCHS